MDKKRYWFKCAALQGNERSQSTLVVMYIEGIGGKEFHSEAERFLMTSATKSCPEAQYCLGEVMRRQGRNKEALQWITLSAAQGSISVQKSLADLYDEKSTVHEMLAFYWSKEAVLAEDEYSMFITSMRLLIITLNRIGVNGFDF